MKNLMTIDGYKAVISYADDIDMLRGDFVGLNGGANFYANDIEGLRREGAISLRIFLEACAKDGREPRKAYSGKFVMRIPPALHESLSVKAATEGESLNQWITETLEREAAE